MLVFISTIIPKLQIIKDYNILMSYLYSNSKLVCNLFYKKLIHSYLQTIEMSAFLSRKFGKLLKLTILCAKVELIPYQNDRI